MIAALMTHAPKTAGGFAELARKGVEIQTEFTATQLPRLAECLNCINQVSASLRFELDDRHRPVISGSITADCNVECHRCLEPKRNVRTVEVASLLAKDETQAVAWWRDDKSANMVVVGADRLELSEFVEDELLVTLSDRVCLDADCKHRPATEFPVVGRPMTNKQVRRGNSTTKTAVEDAVTENEGSKNEGSAPEPGPFAVLAQLKHELE